MTKEEALKKTRDKFTNLLDGDILPRYSVRDIINYYETLIATNKAPIVNKGCGFIDNFFEMVAKEYEKDNSLDEWYGL
jgi:hypothetical protein